MQAPPKRSYPSGAIFCAHFYKCGCEVLRSFVAYHPSAREKAKGWGAELAQELVQEQAASVLGGCALLLVGAESYTHDL